MNSLESTANFVPPLAPGDVIACQFSSWYSKFAKITFRSTIIRTLPLDFREYLFSTGIILPKGSENVVYASTLSDDEISDDEDAPEPNSFDKIYEFPDLDARIRQVIDEYDAVFPKLNWTSPQDSSWVLAPSSPLKCTSPADVYLLLKSSDFIIHDLEYERVFEGCELDPKAEKPTYELELVLRKWYSLEGSRELRCFVRNSQLIALCQRDPNHFDFLSEPATFEKMRQTALRFWNEKVKDVWTESRNYVIDLYLTRDLSNAYIMDFNPYALRTDPILFTYGELDKLFNSQETQPDPPGTTSSPSPLRPLDAEASDPLPIFRIISSPSHALVGRNAPKHAHNMVPREALELSNGRTVADLQEAWKDEIERAVGSGHQSED